MTVTPHRTPEWLFYPGWVVLSAVSLPLAWFLAWALMSQIVKVVGDTIQVGGQTHITEDFLLLYVFCPVLGLLTGLLQYLLLRRYLPRIGGWVVATLLGWLLLAVVLYLVSTLVSRAVSVDTGWSRVLALVLIGGALALPQWLVLRRRVPRASGWLLSSVLGWGLALLAIGDTISSPLDVLAIGLLPPAMASLAWWLLLDQLPQHEGRGGTPPPQAAPVGRGSR